MTGREVRIECLAGRRVRDAEGRPVGRIEEMLCEVVLHERGRDYVVTTVRIGTFGWLDALAGSVLSRELLKKLGRLAGYRQHDVPWDRIDLGQPGGPRLRAPYAISTST